MVVIRTTLKERTRKRRAFRLGNFHRLIIRYPSTTMIHTNVMVRIFSCMGMIELHSSEWKKRSAETRAAAAAGIGRPVKFLLRAFFNISSSLVL